MYWDFGGRELGSGYKNMLPIDYLNGWAATNAYGIGPEAYGMSVEYLNAHPEWSSKWKDTNFHYGINVSKSEEEGGFRLSGGTSLTKPTPDMPELDPEVNLLHIYLSTDDKLYSVRGDVTRYDERELMPGGDAAFSSHFPGAVQFNSSGFKSPGRGFILTGVKAGQTVTVVGQGVMGSVNQADTQEETGTFTFENLTATAVDDFQYEENQGAGPDDESVRVMKFTATADGDFQLGYTDGRIRIYRIYLGDVDVDVTPSNELIRVYDFGAAELNSDVYDNMFSVDLLNDALSTGDGGNINGVDLRTNSIPYDLYVDGNLDPVGLDENFHGNQFPRDFWYIHDSTNSDRWRTSNPELLGFDDNVGGNAPDAGLTGRVYINNNGPRGRYFSIRAEQDNQDVTILFRCENVGTPSTVTVSAIGWDRQEIGFGDAYDVFNSDLKALRVTLPTKGVDYQIWDNTGKLSVYRVYMANVPFDAVTGDDNLGEAPNLSVEDFQPELGSNVRAIGNRIYVSNVTSKTEVKIFSITGQLVKSLEVTRDTNFEFRTGVYIATVKSAEGKKSVKLITH